MRSVRYEKLVVPVHRYRQRNHRHLGAKLSEGFSKPLPSLITVAGYGIAFYCLSLTLRTIPVGVVYAIWSGIGIILVTLVGIVLYQQVPDAITWLGIALIIAGVLVINLLGKTTTH